MNKFCPSFQISKHLLIPKSLQIGVLKYENLWQEPMPSLIQNFEIRFHTYLAAGHIALAHFMQIDFHLHNSHYHLLSPQLNFLRTA